MSFELWLVYFTTVFIASIIPGPSMILALTHGMQFGVRKAAISSFGVIISTMIQAGISIAGLGAILLASEFLFIVIKITGAVYLTYLGIVMLVSNSSFYTDFRTDTFSPTSKKLLGQGFIVSIFNPKAVIFFTAFFPQFIGASGSSAVGYFELMATLAAVHFSCSMIYAYAGKKVISFFTHSSKVITKLIGVFFVVTGLSIMFNSVYSQYLSTENN
ncbi:MAG: LysE family translocator [Deferribacterales bacterium]|jgi:threonine/homoserine/homoserine lactone efflux protein